MIKNTSNNNICKNINTNTINLMIAANDNNKTYKELFNFTKTLINKINNIDNFNKKQNQININNIKELFLENLKIVK